MLQSMVVCLLVLTKMNGRPMAEFWVRASPFLALSLFRFIRFFIIKIWKREQDEKEREREREREKYK